MEPAAHLTALRREGEALSAAARRGVDAAVPGCPGWRVHDLVEHTGLVFLHKAQVVRGETTGPRTAASLPPAPGGVELVPWYDRALAEVLEALEAKEPSHPVWTWFPPDQTARFWYRRMAQEAAVHRVDAEAAHGDAAPVEPELAVDGVDELLDVWLAPAGWDAHGVDQPALPERRVSVHLHATDVEGEWLLAMGPDGVEVDRGHAKGDSALRAPASDLLLWLWGRRPAAALDRYGDDAALDAIRAALVPVTT